MTKQERLEKDRELLSHSFSLEEAGGFGGGVILDDNTDDVVELEDLLAAKERVVKSEILKDVTHILMTNQWFRDKYPNWRDRAAICNRIDDLLLTDESEENE